MSQTSSRTPARSTGPSRSRWRRLAALAGALTLLTGAGIATVASVSAADTASTSEANAKKTRIVQVSGQLIPQDTIGVKYKVLGELIGTWTFPLDQAETLYGSDTRIIQKGVEYFSGCLNTNGDTDCDADEPNGGWRGDYIYWASRDSRLIAGGCSHAMNSGWQSFRGVRGLLQMKDVYASTAAGSTTIYEGEVILNAVAEPAIDPYRPSSATTSGSSTAAATVHAAGC